MDSQHPCSQNELSVIGILSSLQFAMIWMYCFYSNNISHVGYITIFDWICYSYSILLIGYHCYGNTLFHGISYATPQYACNDPSPDTFNIKSNILNMNSLLHTFWKIILAMKVIHLMVYISLHIWITDHDY